MKLSSKPLLAFLFLSLSLSFSCNNDKNEEALNPEEVKETKIKALLAGEISKAWLLEKVSLHRVDITSFYLYPCDRDNPYVLYSNGDGEQRSGEMECTENESEVLREGSWVFENETSTLSLYLGEESRHFTLLQINEENLEMELEEEGNTYLFHFKALE